MADVARVPPVPSQTKRRLVAKRIPDLLPVPVPPSVPNAPKEKKDERDTDLLPRVPMIVNGAEGALMFYKRTFGVEELVRRTKRTNTCPFLLEDDADLAGQLDFGDFAMPVYEARFRVKPPQSRNFFYLTAADPYKFVDQAVRAGAVAEEVFQGVKGLVGRFKDPYGYVWQVSEHEDEPPVPYAFSCRKEGTA